MEDDIQVWVTSYWTFAGTIFAVWIFLTRKLVKYGEHKKDRKRFLRWARKMHLPYRATMQWLLPALAHWLKPTTVEDNPVPEGGVARWDWFVTPRAAKRSDIARMMNNPWSWPVLSLAMTLSILYPILFAAIQWMMTGHGTGLGGFKLLPENVPWYWRYGTIGIIALALSARILASATSKGVFEKLSMWLYAFAGAGAGAFAFAFAGAGAVAGAVAFAVAVASETRRGRGTRAHLCLVIVAVGLAGAFVALGPEDDEAPILLLALVFLPGINALFDWLSYGLTIWLLQQGQWLKGIWPLIAGIVDLVAAGVLFAALASVLVIAFSVINTLRGEVLVDVAAILNNPGAHIWVIAMVGSTLLPTILHLLLGHTSLMTWIPLKVWRFLAHCLDGEKSGLYSGISAGAASALLIVVFGGVPALAYVLLRWLWAHSGFILEIYLTWLRGVLLIFG